MERVGKSEINPSNKMSHAKVPMFYQIKSLNAKKFLSFRTL